MSRPIAHPASRPEPILPRSYLTAFALVTALYFLWGIPANLNDLLIRQFMKSFELSRFQAGLIQSAFYFGYFCFSLPAALVMKRFGYKRGILTGLVLYATGTLLFWPAVRMHRYGAFLFALYVIASGLAFLETGANPFIAEMGSKSGAARRLNFSQAFNPLGAISGLVIGTVFIFSGVELKPAQVVAMKQAGSYSNYLHDESTRVLMPYLVLGLVVLLCAFAIWRVSFPPKRHDEDSSLALSSSVVREVLNNKTLLSAVAVEFLYVGCQVGTWSYFIQYAQDYVHVSEKAGGYLLTGSLIIFAIGRFSGALMMKVFRPAMLLGLYGTINVGLLSVAVLHPGRGGMWALFATSFFMSIMYPTIFAQGLNHVEKNVEMAGAVLVMSIIGGAVITPLIGLLAEQTGMATAFFIPLVGYVAISAFGFHANRANQSA
jgi:FHS family L-fucose permease-like MFS transporter